MTAALDVSMREMERVIIDCMYANLIRGRMDQTRCILSVTFCQARGGGGDMQLTIRHFLHNSERLIDEIDRNMALITQHSTQIRKERGEKEAKRHDIQMNIIAKHPAKYRHVNL